MQQDPSLTYWQVRGSQAVDAVGAVLLWAQQAKGYQCTEACVAELLSLCSIVSIVQDLRLPVPWAGKGCSVSLKGIPPAVLQPLNSYLADLNGYDRRLPADRQRTDQPYKHHEFALLSLGDIQRGAGA